MATLKSRPDLDEQKHPVVPSAVERVPHLGDELGRATDELNEKLVRAEKALANLKLGVSASVTIESNPMEGWGRYLRFCKEANGWHLVVEAGPEDGGDPSDWTSTLLTASSRETRLRAVELLPKLYAALAQAAVTQLEEVKKSGATVDDFIATLPLKGETR